MPPSADVDVSRCQDFGWFDRSITLDLKPPQAFGVYVVEVLQPLRVHLEKQPAQKLSALLNFKSDLDTFGAHGMLLVRPIEGQHLEAGTLGILELDIAVTASPPIVFCIRHLSTVV